MSEDIVATLCKCEVCQDKRETWAAQQPPLAESLNPNDGEDHEPER